MNSRNFFAELKRRKVYSVAVTYAVVGWLLIQVVTQVFPPFEIPNWAERLVILAIIIGFPVALVLGWLFDFTRHGIIRTADLSSDARIDVSPPADSREKSIAVLPFNDLSPAKDHDYFSDGIAEELLGALAKVDGLRVAARRSSFWFKDKEAELNEIASKLNVGHVLEGSVRRDGNRVRVMAELIDACDGFTLWSETYEREMHGIFALQDEITRSIVDALKLNLDISPPPASRSTEAYDAYLHGLFYSDKSTEDALRRSLEFFERALERDPKFSRAWTGIAKAWLWLADAYLPPLEAYPKVRDAAVRALQLNDEEAEAHVYLAESKRILDWDLDGAEAEFNRAVEIDPNSTPSNYFIAALYAARGAAGSKQIRCAFPRPRTRRDCAIIETLSPQRLSPVRSRFFSGSTGNVYPNEGVRIQARCPRCATMTSAARTHVRGRELRHHTLPVRHAHAQLHRPGDSPSPRWPLRGFPALPCGGSCARR